MDCTHTHLRLVAAGLAAVALALAPAVARADGDPASDVLITQPLYLPADASLTPTEQAQLAALVRSAATAGYPIRVAVVASTIDLGSVTPLWHHPTQYAQFLGIELSEMYRGPLLVVMPNGYGYYRASGGTAAGQSTLAALPAPGQRLGAATLTAIERLAGASGHAVTAPATAAPATPGGGGDPVAWIVFAIGAALIAAAWGASLRARPLRG
jgi:hypothetical protein